jgi:hypothetical protein
MKNSLGEMFTLVAISIASGSFSEYTGRADSQGIVWGLCLQGE